MLQEFYHSRSIVIKIGKPTEDVQDFYKTCWNQKSFDSVLCIEFELILFSYNLKHLKQIIIIWEVYMDLSVLL